MYALCVAFRGLTLRKPPPSDQQLDELKGKRRCVTWPQSSFRSTISPLITDVGPAEALVEHVTTEFRDQGRLLEKAEHDLAETKRDLEVCKKALYISDSGRRDLEERFEQEKQALIDEICRLREREARVRDERFEQERQDLNDGIL